MEEGIKTRKRREREADIDGKNMIGDEAMRQNG